MTTPLARRLRSRWGIPLLIVILVAAAGFAGVYRYNDARADRERALADALEGSVRLSVDTAQKWVFERLADTDVVAEIGGDLTPANFIPRFRNSLDGLLDQIATRYRYLSVAVYALEGRQRLAGSQGAPATLPDWLAARLGQAGNMRIGQLAYYGGPDGARSADRRESRQLVFFRGIYTGASADRPFAVAVLTVQGGALDDIVARDGAAVPADGRIYFVRNDAGRVQTLQAVDDVAGRLAALRDMRAATSVEARILGGETAMIEGPDVNGTPVYAAGRRIDPYSTFVVAAIDADDAFRDFHRDTRSNLALGALVVGLTIAVAVVWRRGELYRLRLREAEIQRRFEFTANSAEEAVLLVVDGVIQDVNDRAIAMYGHPRVALIGMPVRELRVPDERARLDEVERAFEVGQDLSYHTIHQRQDGTRFPVEVAVDKLRGGRRTVLNVVIRDLSERRQAEADRRIATGVFEHCVEGILVADDSGRVVLVNPAFCTMSGYGPGDVIGRDAGQFIDAFARMSSDAAIGDSLRANGFWQGEGTGRRKSGDHYHAHLSLSTVRNPEGEAVQMVAICNDLTAVREAQRQIEYLSRFDPVARLPSRQRLVADLEVLLAERHPGCLVAVTGVDRLHQFNETLGYKAGDALIAEIARRLTHVAGELAQVYRFSGSEFVLLLTGEAMEGAQVLAAQAIQALARPIHLEGRTLYLTACVGTAAAPHDGPDAVALLRNGQAALYAARTEGTGVVRAYRPAINRAKLEDLALEERLRGAIGRGELTLHFQPQVSLATGKIIGAEALMRWTHPELGPVPPWRFIAVAEQTGLIIDLGTWVIEQACRHWREWSATIPDLPPIAVNLAALQFQRPGFAREVVDLLQSYVMPSAALQLELTESMVMGDAEAAIAIMQELTRAGIDLAIDDFGTGYSSLSHLQRFPVAKLKIDRSFVLHCDRQPGDAAIVGAIIAMARSMKLRVIAEGVETEGQRAVLRDLGCDEMQGYLFSAPIPADQYAAMLRAR